MRTAAPLPAGTTAARRAKGALRSQGTRARTACSPHPLVRFSVGALGHPPPCSVKSPHPAIRSHLRKVSPSRHPITAQPYPDAPNQTKPSNTQPQLSPNRLSSCALCARVHALMWCVSRSVCALRAVVRSFNARLVSAASIASIRVHVCMLVIASHECTESRSEYGFVRRAWAECSLRIGSYEAVGLVARLSLVVVTVSTIITICAFA